MSVIPIQRARIVVIGERNDNNITHTSIHSAIEDSAHALDLEYPDVAWVRSDEVDSDNLNLLIGADALWCSPGSPYASFEGALSAIKWARVNGVPFLGTCAGFQHAVVEFARSVVGHHKASHAEYEVNPGDELFIDELLCSLVGETMTVRILDDFVASLYPSRVAVEHYYCRFGLNPRWRSTLEDAGLITAGVDDRDDDVRIIRLDEHPFFVATLFVPQTSSSAMYPHP